MKYTVDAMDNDSDYIELEFDPDFHTVNLTSASGTITCSVDEFRELRKAVGYVWQEVEQNG
jgi:hypothetical protein